MSSTINLLEHKDENKPAFTKLKVLRIIAAGLLFGVSVSSVVLFIFISLSPLGILKKQEKDTSVSLSQFDTEIAKLSLLRERAINIKEVMSKRFHYEDTIGLLQQYMSSDLTITSLNMDKNSLSITVSSNSLMSIDKFVNNLIQSAESKKGFSKVTLTSLEFSNSFMLSLKLVTL